MTDWPKIKISELIKRGAILIHKDGNHGSNYPRVDEFGSTGLPFLTAKSIDNWEIDFANAPRLSEKKANTFRFGFVAGGDVLLSHNATVGRVAVVPKDAETAVIGTSLTQFRVDTEQIVPDFLAFYFSSREFQNELSFVMSQTTRNQVPITQQRELSIALPPPSIQKRIANTASALTDKIELNRKTNETLEAMAQAIFKDWFVDFGPVRRQMEGASEPSTILGGLLPPDASNAAAIANLFPDRLTDNRLPDGWEVSKLSDRVEIRRGGSPRPIKDYISTEGYPWTKIADATAQDSPFLFQTKERIRPEGLAKTVKLRSGSLILSNSATPGLPRFLQLEACIHDGWLYFPKIGKLSQEFLYLFFLHVRKQLVAQGNGSVFTNLKTEIVKNFEFPDAPTAVFAEFEQLARTLFSKMLATEKESRTLAETRDYLLPRLMNGSISVRIRETAT